MNIRSNPETTRAAVTTGALPSSRKIYATPASAPDLRGLLQEIPGVNRIADEGANAYRVFSDQDVRTEIARRIVAAGGQIQRVSEAELSLDDIYRRHYESVRRAA